MQKILTIARLSASWWMQWRWRWRGRTTTTTTTVNTINTIDTNNNTVAILAASSSSAIGISNDMPNLTILLSHHLHP